MPSTILVHNDGKDRYQSVEVYSTSFNEVNRGYGQYEDQAILDFKGNINIRIDELIAYRDSLDYKLTKVYVDYKGDPI